MSRKSGKQGLINRSMTDDNFAHTVRLLGACAAWSETIEEGHEVDFNDRNMIQIPVELALAFAKAHASEQNPLGEACHETLKLFEAFRAANKQRSGDRRSRAKKRYPESSLTQSPETARS